MNSLKFVNHFELKSAFYTLIDLLKYDIHTNARSKKLDKLDFSNRHFDGNLLISGAQCSEINLENCKIDRNVIIDNNNSIVKLTGSTINGTIIVNLC